MHISLFVHSCFDFCTWDVVLLLHPVDSSLDVNDLDLYLLCTTRITWLKDFGLDKLKSSLKAMLTIDGVSCENLRYDIWMI